METQKIDTATMTVLERNVYGQNKINGLALKAVAHLNNQLDNFIGKKIFLADGSKAKIFNPDYFTYNNGAEKLRTYLEVSYGVLNMVIDVTVVTNHHKDGGCTVQYFKKSIAVADVENGILIKVYTDSKIFEASGINKVYNIDYIQKQVDKIKELQAEIELYAKDVSMFININSNY